MADVGKRIKLLREARELTQSELSDRMGVTKQTISQYERGVRAPSLEMIKKIADALEVSESMVLDLKPSRSNKLNRDALLGLTIDFVEEIYKSCDLEEELKLSYLDFLKSDQYFLNELVDIFIKIAYVKVDTIKEKILYKDNAKYGE